jgi:hypothetical protein
MAAFERGDLATALKEFRPLAEQGVADAQFSLAPMYDNGEGVPTHYVKAHMWFSLAQAQDITPTADNLDIIKKQMTPAQIAKAQELAAEWWEERVAILKKSSRRSNYGVVGLIKPKHQAVARMLCY